MKQAPLLLCGLGFPLLPVSAFGRRRRLRKSGEFATLNAFVAGAHANPTRVAHHNVATCRFVPALNVIATEFNIPDDVAGATLMAAGASSPELFSSIVSLFITHSALGLGTIVGSEIFNQLIICAGAVYAARKGKLHLDKAILMREVGFYALAILLLYWALRDHRPAEDDDEGGPDHM